MYARSTTVKAKTTSIDAGISYIRDDAMPQVQNISGSIGVSMMVDRTSGRCIVTSAWRSREEMQASWQHVSGFRDRLAQVLGGTAQVDEWEIAVLHRAHRSPEGACIRATWMKVDPGQIDQAIDVYRMGSLPDIENLEGFCSASLLVDRESGRAVSSVTFDSPAAMERNRRQADTMRAAGTKRARAEILEVEEFDLALAHLHVPEAV